MQKSATLLAAPHLAIALVAALACTSAAQAEDPPNVEAVNNNGERWFNSDEIPTYKIEADGTVDWNTFSGFRRYHAECHVCHGPDGEGSTYAPALKTSAITMDYYDFVGVVAGGRQKVGAAENQVMPAFGVNPNVMCYLDDIYVYLRARGTDAVPRGRPAKKADKPEAYSANEASCMGG